MYKIARVGLHHFEEPCLSGERGSGTIFFSGCNLRCLFCQNFEISHGGKGLEVSEKQLVSLMLYLQDSGAHNINLVTPSNYTNLLKIRLKLQNRNLKYRLCGTAADMKPCKTSKNSTVWSIFICPILSIPMTIWHGNIRMQKGIEKLPLTQ